MKLTELHNINEGTFYAYVLAGDHYARYIINAKNRQEAEDVVSAQAQQQDFDNDIEVDMMDEDEMLEMMDKANFEELKQEYEIEMPKPGTAFKFDDGS